MALGTTRSRSVPHIGDRSRQQMLHAALAIPVEPGTRSWVDVRNGMRR